MTPFHPDLDAAIEGAIEVESDIRSSTEGITDTKIMHVSPDFQCFFCGGKHTMKLYPEIAEFRKAMTSNKANKKESETQNSKDTYSGETNKSNGIPAREESNKLRENNRNNQERRKSVTFEDQRPKMNAQNPSNYTSENYHGRNPNQQNFEANNYRNRNF